MVKKTPLRKCVACNEMKDKRDLLRIVKNKEEGILIDPTGKKNGRGCYVCKSRKCIELLKKSKKINKVFKQDVDDHVYEELDNYVNE